MTSGSPSTMRRALTLLEVLIVLAVLVAIAAMVVAPAANLLDRRAFDAAADLLRDHLLLARAHAQLTGEPVEVRWRAAPSRLEARLFRLDGDATPVDFAADDSDPLELADDDLMDDPWVDDAAIAEGWAERPLPAGVIMTDRRPEPVGYDDGFAALEIEGYGDEPAATVIRLVIYMPDGSSLIAKPAWMVDESLGRAIRLDVNPWSGDPTLTLVDLTADPMSDGETDEDAEPEDLEPVDAPAPDDGDGAPVGDSGDAVDNEDNDDGDDGDDDDDDEGGGR